MTRRAVRPAARLLLCLLACLAAAGCKDLTRVQVETGPDAPEVVLENASRRPITAALDGPLADAHAIHGPVDLRLELAPGERQARTVPPGRYGYDAWGKGLRGAAGYVEVEPKKRYRMRFFLIDPDAPPTETPPALIEEEAPPPPPGRND